MLDDERESFAPDDIYPDTEPVTDSIPEPETEPERPKRNKDKQSLFHSPNTVNIIAIFIIATFCIIIVIFLAKGLFASNNADVPEGIYTGTVSTMPSSLPPAETASAPDAEPAGSDPAAETTTVPATAAPTETTTTSDPNKAYITNYVQLLAQPQADAEHIICMSPNIEVTVLERRQDGYVKVTFMNGDGTDCTGYVESSYLKATKDETTTAAETEPPAETAPAEEAPPPEA